jgi:hypothetical protein
MAGRFPLPIFYQKTEKKSMPVLAENAHPSETQAGEWGVLQSIMQNGLPMELLCL